MLTTVELGWTKVHVRKLRLQRGKVTPINGSCRQAIREQRQTIIARHRL